jgi:hypothetical protein
MRKTFLCMLAASLILAAHAAARVPTGSVGGTVFSRNGTSAAGAEVMLERSDGSAPVAVKTDSSGRYLFKFVLPGYYDIRASRGSLATIWKHNVMVHAGKETAIDLRLEPAGQKPTK